MGFGHYVALEKDIDIACDIHPTILFRFRSDGDVPNIQKIEEQLGLTPLTMLQSVSTADQLKWIDEYEGDLADDIVPEPEEWFEPVQGIETVRGLLGYFQRNRTTTYAADFIDALEGTLRDLEAADKMKSHFHFAVVTP